MLPFRALIRQDIAGRTLLWGGAMSHNSVWDGRSWPTVPGHAGNLGSSVRPNRMPFKNTSPQLPSERWEQGGNSLPIGKTKAHFLFEIPVHWVYWVSKAATRPFTRVLGKHNKIPMPVIVYEKARLHPPYCSAVIRMENGSYSLSGVLCQG